MLTKRQLSGVVLLGVVATGCATPQLGAVVPSAGLTTQGIFQKVESGLERERRRRDEHKHRRGTQPGRPSRPQDPPHRERPGYQEPIRREPIYRDPVERVVVVPRPESPKFIRVWTTDVTASGFTVHWITDQTAAGMLEWGTTDFANHSDRLWPPDYEQSYTVTGAQPDTTYQYRILAMRDGGGGYAQTPTMTVTTAQ